MVPRDEEPRDFRKLRFKESKHLEQAFLVCLKRWTMTDSAIRDYFSMLLFGRSLLMSFILKLPGKRKHGEGY